MSVCGPSCCSVSGAVCTSPPLLLFLLTNTVKRQRILWEKAHRLAVKLSEPAHEKRHRIRLGKCHRSVHDFAHLRILSPPPPHQFHLQLFFYQICSRSKVAISARGVWKWWLTELLTLLYHNGLYVCRLESSLIPFWLECSLCDAFRCSLFWQGQGRPEAMQLLTFVVASSLMTGWCVGVFKPTRAQKKRKKKKKHKLLCRFGCLATI